MAKSKLDIIKEVVENHQYTKISMLIGTKRRSVILDAQTANSLLNLFNQVPEENKSKLEKLPWHRLCQIINTHNF